MLVTFAAIELGIAARPVMRFLAILTLAAIGIIMVFRPLIPTLPIKVDMDDDQDPISYGKMEFYFSF